MKKSCDRRVERRMMAHLDAKAGSQIANRVIVRATVIVVVAASCRVHGAATPGEAHLAHGEGAAACVLGRTGAPFVTNHFRRCR